LHVMFFGFDLIIVLLFEFGFKKAQRFVLLHSQLYQILFLLFFSLLGELCLLFVHLLSFLLR
jgi:hypothetical protein